MDLNIHLHIHDERVGHKIDQAIALLRSVSEQTGQIMSAISDFAAKVNTAFDAVGTAVDGVAGDVQFLKDEIAKLQNTPGPISAEDQATLDGLQARADALTSKVQALDALTDAAPTP